MGRLESIQAWSDVMKRSSTWNFRSIVGKIMMGLIVAAMIGSADVVPSFSADNHGRGGRQGGGRSEQRGRGHDRGRNWHGGGRGYRSYGYGERVYVPPPAIYAPPPPVGIGIFFPSIVIRP
jgi:uncharacterized membrane protein